MKKTIITLLMALMVASMSILGVSQEYGSEIKITPGIHPHCTRSHDGSLHVVLVNGDQIQYVRVDPNGIPGNPETIAYGSDLQAPYITESKNKLLHVVWGEGYNSMYSNNMGGSWQVKTMIPTISGYSKNRFPHVTGGYGNEAYVASWNHTAESIRIGVHAAYQINIDNTGSVTEIKNKVLGKVCEVAPSIVGPTGLLDCGGKVFAVATAPGGPDYYAYELNENFDITWVGALGNRSPFARWTRGGINAFPMEDGPAFLGELRTSSKSPTTPKISGVMVNFKGSEKIGAMFVDYAPKWCCPRGTYDPVSKNIYGIYNKRGTFVLGIFNTDTYSLQEVSSQPVSEEISAVTKHGQCGWGAGGIAARIDGGAEMVYSVDSMVKMRSVNYLPASARTPQAQQISDSRVATDCKRRVEKWGSLNGKSYQQDAIRTYKGWQYVSYYTSVAPRRVVLARRSLSSPNEKWEKIVFEDYEQIAEDGHNIISMGICEDDGTIHLAYDHHADTLHYRRSKVAIAEHPNAYPWDASQFTEMLSTLHDSTQLTRVTYPRFFTAPDGKLHLVYRHGGSGDGDSWMYTYSMGLWKCLGKFIEGGSANAYFDGLTFDENGRLHMSWCWRETPAGNTNHDICYAYSDDKGLTWCNAQGQKIATTDLSPIEQSSQGITIKAVPQKSGLINQMTMTVDGKGRPHIVQSFGGSLHHLYLDRFGKWHDQKLEISSRTRPKICVDSYDNAYILSGGLQILAASPASDYKKWELVNNEAQDFGSAPQFDRYRLRESGILSVFMIKRTTDHLHVLDYRLPFSPNKIATTQGAQTPMLKKKVEEQSNKEITPQKKRPLYEPRAYNGLSYRLMKPKNYIEGKSYPLILSLHGIDGAGSDNVKNLTSYNQKVMATDEWRSQYPCFVLVPQCETPPWVRPQTVRQMLKDGKLKNESNFLAIADGPDDANLEQVFQVVEGLRRDFRYQIDSQRIYVLGNAMGGSGSWTALQEKPDLFAAAISVCGELVEFGEQGIASAKDVPVWIFCGKEDELVQKSEQAYKRFKAVGGNIKYTKLKGVGHESWPIAFQYKGDDSGKGFVTKMSDKQCDKEMDVWTWLFNQKRGDL